MTGTARNDRLVGTPSADVIRGLAGNDQLLGRGGADFLQGGPGRDTVDAGAGSDLVAVSYDGARDTTRCGSGLDVVNADLTDAVARDCELVGRRLSRDPLPEHGRAARDRGRAGQLHVRADDRRDLPGRPTRRRSGDERRLRGDDRRRCDVAQRAPTRPDRRERPCRTESTRERSGRRLRRCARHLAHLDARAGRRDHAARRQPLAERLDVETRARRRSKSSAGGDEGIAFDKNWVACDNTRRRRSTVAATSSTRTRPTATCSPCVGRTTAV